MWQKLPQKWPQRAWMDLRNICACTLEVRCTPTHRKHSTSKVKKILKITGFFWHVVTLKNFLSWCGDFFWHPEVWGPVVYNIPKVPGKDGEATWHGTAFADFGPGVWENQWSHDSWIFLCQFRGPIFLNLIQQSSNKHLRWLHFILIFHHFLRFSAVSFNACGKSRDV